MKFWKKKGLKVCILAMAKSGSTALFQSIRNRMSGEVFERFEPHTLDEAKDYLREQQVLTKIIPFDRNDGDWKAGLKHFDHQLVMVRDPRDLILRLRSKLDAPAAHNMLGGVTFQISERFLAGIHGKYMTLQQLVHEGGRLIMYDDVISGNLDSLWRDLRLPREPLQTDNRWGHVPRTKASGNWRRWFTEADVAVMRPHIDPVLQMFEGLDPNWDLAKSPQLTPAESMRISH